ncbi:chorismate synthase [Nitratidesulfovibrio sp. HK-II]|jgi:chorismate synthase|uniref:chorismate synthase n=1 Tax=Nitratidesulfovibrio sp. HK-II TaxID=2009266 RepID=UPI000E2F9C62|nr:chorismate synthase [Nitratidesulfovibrio sp. HK-II]GBO94977.1 chorismate synthase [Nitratidesulfovibrio sp. HK-II]HCG04207.1 chorismate synthase [Desulfovibrio sp.]
MSGNTFGRIFRLTTYGESHGPGLGGVVDGCPAGVPLDEAAIQRELDLRRPGSASAGLAGTARKEPDTVRLLSGVFEGVTTGTPIGFHIANEDQRSRDYGDLAKLYRPGHADITYDAKYGLRDHRGGGRASGRETVSRVAGGAVALALLAMHDISVRAYTVEIGGVPADVVDPAGAQERMFFSPDPDVVPAWESLVHDVRAEGDTLGGIVQVEATGVPAGLGEPVFDKLDALLAHALMSVGAVKAVEVGAGLEAARLRGSENNDPIVPGGFHTNHAGGILGGISNGQPIVVRAAVKPIPSIAQEQITIDTNGRPAPLRVGGRHDICAIPRVVPVLKAMVALVLADSLLLQRRMG